MRLFRRDGATRDRDVGGPTRVELTDDGHREVETPVGDRSVSGPARPSRLRPFLLGACLVLVLGIVAQLVPLPYVLLRPGPAVDILASGSKQPVIEVSGAQTYPTTGALYFTTVAQYGGPGRRPSAWEVATAAIDPASVVLPEEEVFPPQVTQDQIKQGNTVAMTDSQQEATAVVMRALGRPVTEKAVVAQVVPGSAAEGVLKEGDVVTQVGDVRVTRAPQIAETVQKTTGDTLNLVLVRDGRSRTVTVRPKVTDGRRMIGILVRSTFDSPVTVTFHAGDVGGPSAGMMFSLGLYDELTPGPMTGGQNIAGTGTLDSAGKVGPIGGIRQKMVGAHDGGATWFLAPKDNCNEVTDHIPGGLRVTPVSSFDEGRNAVEKIAAGQGNSLPSCP